jgi:hypothetical protein
MFLRVFLVLMNTVGTLSQLLVNIGMFRCCSSYVLTFMLALSMCFPSMFPALFRLCFNIYGCFIRLQSDNILASGAPFSSFSSMLNLIYLLRLLAASLLSYYLFL